MNNGIVVIICLVSAMLFLMIAAGVALAVVLWRRLPAVKLFFQNLASGIEHNQAQIDELKSALAEYHAELGATIPPANKNAWISFGNCVPN